MSVSEPAALSRRSVLRLRVIAEADPQSVARVLERFVNLDITPRRVRAEWGTRGVLHIEVDVAGLSEDVMSLIAAKVGQAPPIINAYWHYL